ncbi:hypothetical protein HGA91_03820 [candidate division WWE3 bacterium]|nr:hypothetical protein [candidate division WWE3 bacterium]
MRIGSHKVTVGELAVSTAVFLLLANLVVGFLSWRTQSEILQQNVRLQAYQNNQSLILRQVNQRQTALLEMPHQPEGWTPIGNLEPRANISVESLKGYTFGTTFYTGRTLTPGEVSWLITEGPQNGVQLMTGAIGFIGGSSSTHGLFEVTQNGSLSWHDSKGAITPLAITLPLGQEIFVTTNGVVAGMEFSEVQRMVLYIDPHYHQLSAAYIPVPKNQPRPGITSRPIIYIKDSALGE